MNLTASDRKALIRLASTLPKGSQERRVILSGLKKAAGKLRSFNQYDWNNWSGASPFGDDSEPLIGDFGPLKTPVLEDDEGEPDEAFLEGTIIVDGGGVTLAFFDDEGEEKNYFSRERFGNPEEGQKVALKVLQELERGKLPRGFREL